MNGQVTLDSANGDDSLQLEFYSSNDNQHLGAKPLHASTLSPQFASVLNITPGTTSIYARLTDARGELATTPVQSVTVGNDADGDGVSSQIENLGGDGNHDGVADSEQAGVTSIPDSRTGQFVTIDAGQHSLHQVRTTPATEQSIIERRSPFGMLAYEVRGFDIGQVATVEITYPTDVALQTTYKQDAGLSTICV